MEMCWNSYKRLFGLLGLSAIFMVGADIHKTDGLYTQRTAQTSQNDAVYEETLLLEDDGGNTMEHMPKYRRVHYHEVRTSEIHHLRREHDNSNSSNEATANCTAPRDYPKYWYNSSCQYVHEECAGQSQLLNYLAFVVCTLDNVKV